MIGQRIEASGESPWLEIILVLPAIALIALAVALQDAVWAAVAILPFAISIALWLTRRRMFAAEFTDEGVLVEGSTGLIPYSQIHYVRPMESMDQSRFAIRVYHDGGILVIPQALNVSSREIHDFLAAQMAGDEGRPLPAALEDYWHKHAAEFGEERVLCFRARRVLGGMPRRRRWIAICTAFVVTGILWLTIGGIAAAADAGKQFMPLLGLGCVFLPMFFVFVVALLFERQRAPFKNWESSGLIVGPVGMAMIQGTLRGELKWAEIQGIYFPYKASGFTSHWERITPAIGIVVKGATILVKDVYDHSLPVIHEQLRWHWSGE